MGFFLLPGRSRTLADTTRTCFSDIGDLEIFGIPPMDRGDSEMT